MESILDWWHRFGFMDWALVCWCAGLDSWNLGVGLRFRKESESGCVEVYRKGVADVLVACLKYFT